jgi:hypothetical protein
MTARSRLRLRLGSLLAEEEDPLVDHGAIQLRDVFDLRSGGVRLRDWELDDRAVSKSLGVLFGEPDHHAASRSEPKCRFVMYTDTALLLRGPAYYMAETAEPTERRIGPFLAMTNELLRRTVAATEDLLNQPFAFGTFKLLAGVLDYVRNALLHALAAAYATRGTAPEMPQRIHELLHEHIETHLSFLFDADGNWQASLGSCLAHVAKVADALPELTSNHHFANAELPGMRECDSFVENVMAVEIGLRKLRRQPTLREGDGIVGVGLLRGGVELPVLAEVVAKRTGWRCRPALLSISTYSSQRDRTSRIRAGDAAYVQSLRDEGQEQLLTIDSSEPLENLPLVLMDDNCTTATTLQNARDLLLLLGFDVVGAVVVRYPGVNRQVHMALPKHGLPDPQALFGFIRGLVAPSPYTRLLVPGETDGDIYRDQRGVFNKSKNRIERYLLKNGTPALDKDGTPVMS